MTATTGMLSGRHFTGWMELLDGLYDSRQMAAYERLLLDCISVAETEADDRNAPEVAELYERLLHLYRRRGEVDAEQALLVWWTAQSFMSGAITEATVTRLEQLRQRHPG